MEFAVAGGRSPNTIVAGTCVVLFLNDPAVATFMVDECLGWVSKIANFEIGGGGGALFLPVGLVVHFDLVV